MQMQDVEDFYPLSPLQQGILFHSLSQPSSRMYFNQTLATLSGELDPEVFRAAWQDVIARHPILRTFFVWEGVKSPVQVVKKSVAMPFEVQDWRGLDEEQRARRLEELRREDLRQGFDLSRPPLMRALLLRSGDDRHQLLWTFHHILMDGWSMFHVLQELFWGYDQRRAGRTPQAKAPPPYRTHIAWLQKQSLQRAEAFWRRTLAGFTAPTPLPFEPAPAAGEGEDFEARTARVSARTSAALESLARERRLTLNTILQASWALLLARSSGEREVVFGAVVSGRPPELDGVESMVGLFINTLAVRVEVPPSARLADWLVALQAQQAELREYEYTPLVEVRGWSEVPGGAALFDSIFLFENYHKDAPIEELCRSLKISDVQWFERHNYPLAAVVIPGPELCLRVIYQTQRYTSEQIDRLLDAWRTLLDGMAQDAEARLADLSLLAPDEGAALVRRYNQTSSAYPRECCIHELFARVAHRTPDAPALSAGDRTIDYGELNARANRLAHHLRRLGVGPDVLVALSLERSVDMVVAILGILKAGGAYVALDPDYPTERLEFMLEDTRAPVLVSTKELAERLPAHAARTVLLDRDAERIAAESDQDPAQVTTPLHLAYVIYTSGSTGRPKGTCVPHRAVVRLVRDTDFLTVTPDDVFLQFATISFDASTLELWAPLLNGARLALFPPGTPSLEELGRVVAQEGVTVLWLTAGLFHRMVEENLDGLTGVRQLLAGGDVLSVRHVQKALAELDGCVVINGYGPTENTTFTCCHRMEPGDGPKLGATVPIGRPIANTTAMILDESLRPVPVGVPGDLWTGGDGVARGYLNRPELTAERFRPDPFASEPGARMYQTGDRARMRPDGVIEFLGRRDFQVKIRGFRIELGEIETALGSHPAVKSAVVLARPDESGDKRLLAYVVGDEVPPADALRAHVLERLPAYMVPAAFVTLDAFPLTANGKVDRDALPDPESSRPELETAFAAPQADTERTIARVWGQVLGLEGVGVHDNFFDLGGHSLAMIRVHGMLQKAGLQLAMVDLFKYPTVHALARFLDGDSERESAAEEPPPQTRSAGKDRLRQMRERRRRST